MKSQLINAVWFALVMGGGCVVAPPWLAGQTGLPRDPARFGARVGLVESALGNAEEIGLSSEQLARLRELHTQSLERSGAARETIKLWQAAIEGEGEEADSQDSRGDDPASQSRRRSPRRADLTPEVRGALRALHDERRALVAELEATVTVEQMRVLRDLVPVGRARVRMDGAIRSAQPNGPSASPGKAELDALSYAVSTEIMTGSGATEY